MANELATRESRALVETGVLTRLQEQVLRTVPGAADAPIEVVMGACVLADRLGLNIATGEVYIGTFGSVKDDASGKWVKQYSYGVGVKGCRVLADREARHQISFRELTPEECRKLRGDQYDPGDIGIEATCVRFDDAMLAKQVGIAYVPQKATGFWRVKARYNSFKKEWVSDQVPNTWTAQDVAEKRATVSVLKKAFAFGARTNVRIIDPMIEAGVPMLADGDTGEIDGEFVDASAAAAKTAQRILDDHRREMQAPVSDGTIDEDGYIVETAAEKMRRTRQAIPVERVADSMADQAGTPKLSPLHDWSSGVWDVRVEDVHTGAWEGLGTDAETGLRTWLHRGADTPPDVELWNAAKAAMDAKLGTSGTYIVVACLTGITKGDEIPGAISRGLIDAANGKAAKAMAALETYAQQLQDNIAGDPDQIPFGDESNE